MRTLLLFAALVVAGPALAQDKLFATVLGPTRPPIGWVEFCAEYKEDCNVPVLQARDAMLTDAKWRELKKVNYWVNSNVKDLTDLEQWGVMERWSYPADGYGDCEDYVILKRRMLLEMGWPRQALLITVVRDLRGDGHAVLTVKTDRGEYFLDNGHDEILLWSQTTYTLVKRQSQTNPNVWVSLRPAQPEPVYLPLDD